MKTDLNIQKLGPADIALFEELIKLFEEVFEMKDFAMPDSQHLNNLLADETFAAFVAVEGNKVIGGLTTYTLKQYYSVKPLAYIYDLAVLTQHQRKGIGKALIQYTKTYYREQGYEEVFVQADKVDQYALDFYRQTRPTEEEDVLHFYYALNQEDINVGT